MPKASHYVVYELFGGASDEFGFKHRESKYQYLTMVQTVKQAASGCATPLESFPLVIRVYYKCLMPSASPFQLAGGSIRKPPRQ